jgi:hypothetical protein
VAPRSRPKPGLLALWSRGGIISGRLNDFPDAFGLRAPGLWLLARLKAAWLMATPCCLVHAIDVPAPVSFACVVPSQSHRWALRPVKPSKRLSFFFFFSSRVLAWIGVCVALRFDSFSIFTWRPSPPSVAGKGVFPRESGPPPRVPLRSKLIRLAASSLVKSGLALGPLILSLFR